MNLKHYEEIYDLFTEYHGHMVADVVDYRPRGDLGIRLTMHNGDRYDFDTISKGVRKARDHYELAKDEITDELCRRSFADHLTEMMGVRGFTQQTLAEYTGISKGSINAYINKAKTPSITNLRKIAYALDCSIAELMD